jgi:Ca2+-binding EF-hand superfamily protein
MRKLVLAAILVLSGAPAGAQEVQNNLFISPAGEPFLAPINKPYPIVNWFNQADANHDGKLDAAEFRADAERFFAVLDRNKDGVLDAREISIYEHYYVPEILPQQGADAGGLLIRVMMQFGGGAGGPGGIQPIDPGGGAPDEPPSQRQRLDSQQGAVPYSLFASPEPVLSADRNLDSKVSLKEFQAQSDRRFAALDTKMRGYLTLDDLPKTDFEIAVKAKRK